MNEFQNIEINEKKQITARYLGGVFTISKTTHKMYLKV